MGLSPNKETFKRIMEKLQKGEALDEEEFSFCKSHQELFEKLRFKRTNV